MHWLVLIPVLAVFYWILTKRKRLIRKIKRTPFPNSWKTILHKEVAFYNALEPKQQQRFEKSIQYFLATTTVSGIKTTMEDKTRLLVASSAIIPVFGIPNWHYDNLGEVLVFPEALENHFIDKEGEGTTLGRVQPFQGSYVLSLSKTSLENGFKNIRDKHNVGVHEFVHLIDQADGEIDGIPSLLMPESLIPIWKELVSQEIDQIKKRKSDINSYGGTSEIEFLAVTSEYFFENPIAFSKKHPEIFHVLEQIFHQDFDNKSYFNPDRYFNTFGKKYPRNALCPCGSNKKYKNCCLTDQ